ncbi:hypothetical protein [Streptomyces sp. NPDC093514]|uniref:hypothetical protein n=1 Tax=Streptomyces sp. NPDC093514 TaxID=3366039 RepID=UPI0038113E31
MCADAGPGSGSGPGPDVREHHVPLLLDRLVERSLVVLVDRPERGRRYRLLESVKDYARERLRAAGEEGDTRARHGTYYRELALRAEPLLRGPHQRLWLARLDAAEAELHPAVKGALARGHLVPALRAARALARYWLLRGRPAEAGRLLDACLAAERTHRAHRAHRAPPAGPGRGPHAGERIAATALATAWRAGLTVWEGTPTSAAGLLRTAATTLDAREVAGHDPLGHAHALWFLAAAQMGAGDVPTGEQLADRALVAAEGLGDAWGTAAALAVRARHALAHGDLAAVRRDAERAAHLFSGLGDRWGLLQTVFPRAALHEIAGEYRQRPGCTRRAWPSPRSSGCGPRPGSGCAHWAGRRSWRARTRRAGNGTPRPCGWPGSRATAPGRPTPGSDSAWSRAAPATSPAPKSTCRRC